MKEKRFNLITQNWEPFMPTKLRLLRFIGSGVTVLFFVCLIFSAVG